MDLDVNSAGTRMISCSKSQEIIYWDLNLKAPRSILTTFEEEHDNIIDVVVFAPLKAAKTIIKARMEQDQEADEQTGGTPGDEEGKQEEAENNGEKEPTSASNALAKRSEEMKKARERLAQLKSKIGSKSNNKDAEEEKKEESKEDDIEVKYDIVASGSRDKRIKIWNTKRGT